MRECGEILTNRPVGPGLFELSARLPKIVAQAEPGQFVHVRVASGYDPLLLRPFSVYRADFFSGPSPLRGGEFPIRSDGRVPPSLAGKVPSGSRCYGGKSHFPIVSRGAGGELTAGR